MSTVIEGVEALGVFVAALQQMERHEQLAALNWLFERYRVEYRVGPPPSLLVTCWNCNADIQVQQS